ncbi:hypothetical protein Ciccas_011555, partial [Cichlidogyrus casuarinus]
MNKIIDLGKNFSCDHCDYKATTQSNLKRHLRIHFGARPYKCPHCDYRSVELDALRKHVFNSTIHPGLPLYLCPYCLPSKDEEVDDLSLMNMVGFNTLTLAHQHLREKHLDKIKHFSHSSSITMENFNERLVTRIFGLYDPSWDRIAPKEGDMIIQPRESSRTLKHKQIQLNKILNRIGTEKQANSKKVSLTNLKKIVVVTHMSNQTPILKTQTLDLQNESPPIESSHKDFTRLYLLAMTDSEQDYALWSMPIVMYDRSWKQIRSRRVAERERQILEKLSPKKNRLKVTLNIPMRESSTVRHAACTSKLRMIEHHCCPICAKCYMTINGVGQCRCRYERNLRLQIESISLAESGTTPKTMSPTHMEEE